jgi:WD40 repeat protein
MSVVDVKTGEQIAEIQSAISPLDASVALAPDDAAMASLGMEISGGNRKVTAQVWDLETGQLKRSIEVSAAGLGWSMALSPGGKVLVVAHSPLLGRPPAEKIALWDVATVKVKAQLSIDSANSILFSPDGSMLATGANGVVSLWDAASGHLLLESLTTSDGFFA